MLESLGYQAVACMDGSCAVEMVKRNEDEVDLVILDMIMPGMDGGKTFDAIRKLRPRMPVILSSGYAMDGRAEEIMGRGCNAFIQKPYSLSELSKTIRKVLDTTKK
jgi:CheY-like chemotaxis protein